MLTDDAPRRVLEAWRAPGGEVSIVLCRQRDQAPRGVVRTPLSLSQLAEIDLDAHRLLVIDGHNTAQLAAPLFTRRVLAVLGNQERSPRRHRQVVEVVSV